MYQYFLFFIQFTMIIWIYNLKIFFKTMYAILSLFYNFFTFAEFIALASEVYMCVCVCLQVSNTSTYPLFLINCMLDKYKFHRTLLNNQTKTLNFLPTWILMIVVILNTLLIEKVLMGNFMKKTSFILVHIPIMDASKLVEKLFFEAVSIYLSR